MKNNKKWQVLYKSPITSHKSLIDILLANRGIRSRKEKQEFFEPTPPLKIGLKELGISEKSVNTAIERIRKALKSKEKVIVYGDYDADGICGTAILWECLYSLGLNVLPYIPERFSEGYGLNIKSLEKLKTLNPKLKLIITVDHGIVANKKIDIARELGIDVIITDHHEPGKKKPKACATIHTTKISGAAVAWVLSREIIKKSSSFKVGPRARSDLERRLELAAIGTISDQLPLIGPNRPFVKYGLAALNRTKRPGLLALFEEAGITLGSIGPYEVGFIIAPRINAMGRLTHAIDSLRLLCTKKKSQAEELAAILGKTNAERQRIVDEVVLHARENLGNKVKNGVIVLAHKEYHEGVIGLAAAKLVEEFYRPAIVLSKKGEISKASARSITGFNIIEAIRKLESLYIEGGGHSMAAGFSIETAKIEEFTRRINELAQPLLTKDLLTRRLKADLEIRFNQINWDLFRELEDFEPTGLGNPTSTFVSRNIEVLGARTAGKESKHLKLRLRQGEQIFDSIAFGAGNFYSKITPSARIDIVYQLEENTWNGRKELQLKIKDFKLT